MTTELEAAQKTLNDLLDSRDAIVARAAKLNHDRTKLAYAAHTGDAKAKDQLRKANDGVVLANLELETIDAAIAEANARLEAARQAEAQAAEVANAQALQVKLAKFRELGDVLDDCFVDFRTAALEMKAVVDDIHRLGCAIPDNQLYKVNCDLAFKTAVANTPFWSQDFPAMRSHERKTFRSLVASWASSIEAHINAHLQKEEAVA